jgi:hypothetical protein
MLLRAYITFKFQFDINGKHWYTNKSDIGFLQGQLARIEKGFIISNYRHIMGWGKWIKKIMIKFVLSAHVNTI